MPRQSSDRFSILIFCFIILILIFQPLEVSNELNNTTIDDNFFATSRPNTPLQNQFRYQVNKVVSSSKIVAGVDPKISYFHEDATGNLVAMTSSTGQVTWRANMRPFGQGSSTSSAHPLRFLDQPLEGAISSEGGLYHLGARYYDPLIGRFLSPDPISLTNVPVGEPQRFNQYTYALNNPYRFRDGSGLEPEENTGSNPNKGRTSLLDIFWFVGDLADARANPTSLLNIIGKTSSTVGLLAKESGDEGVAGGATLINYSLWAKEFAQTGALSPWSALSIAGTVYGESVYRYLVASEKLHDALQGPNAFRSGYNQYTLEQVKGFCEAGGYNACKYFASHDGDLTTLQFKPSENNPK